MPDSRDDAGTIGAAVRRRAGLAGSRPALVDTASQGATFSGLCAILSAFGESLAAAGLSRADRVGLLVPPGTAGAQLIVGLASHVTLVPLNPRLTPDELAELVGVNSLTAMVFPQWLDAAPARAKIETRQIAVLEAALGARGETSLRVLKRGRRPAAAPSPPGPDDAALLLRSSGTTGAPKLIPVTHRNLVAMAERLSSAYWFGLGQDDRVACTLPLYYAAGIKTSLLVPLLLGQTVGFPLPAKVLDLAEWIHQLDPTYLSVAPAQLKGMLDRLRVAARPFDSRALRFIMSAASYLPEDVRLAAQSMLRVPVLEFYGLSEAGIMAANPAPPGRAKPGTVGLPATGELLVVDEDRQPVADGRVGQIMICGPTLTPGYAAAEDRGGGAFRDGWLLTGDLGRIDEDGYLTIVGRVKEVINRGGEKVFPYEVEKVLLRHPAVLDAAAFAVPHARLGESVAAAAVLKPGCAASEQELKDFLSRSLVGFKVPRRLHVVEELPRGSTGKVLRGELSAKFAARGRHAVAPHYHLLEYELRDIWERLLGTGDLGLDDDFLDKGGDSLLATEMLVEVERLTGKPYPRADLSTLTIRRIYEVTQSNLAGERELITRARGGSGAPLFFCHGDSLTRGIYAHKLAALLPDDQPVFLLHCYPDRSLGSSIEDIAQAYLHEVLELSRGAPVFVGGFCHGGLAAWHLAHLLRLRGVEVLGVLLVDTFSLNARADLRLLAALFRIAGRVVPGRMGRLLREKAMVAAWTWKRGRITSRSAMRSSGTKDGADSAMRMYLQFMSRYVPPRIAASVTCFTAEGGARTDSDPRFWRSLATQVSEVSVPGSHVGAIVSERPALAAAMSRVLARPAPHPELSNDVIRRSYA